MATIQSTDQNSPYLINKCNHDDECANTQQCLPNFRGLGKRCFEVCDYSSECASNLCIKNLLAVTFICDNCGSDSDCPGSSQCIDGWRCEMPCNNFDDQTVCQPYESCVEGFCERTSCSTDSECGEFLCDTTRGECSSSHFDPPIVKIPL